MNSISILDYRLRAKQVLSKEIFDFIDGAACDEITKKSNREAFDKICVKPFCLRDVSNIDLSTKLLDRTLAAPIFIAPTAFHRLVDEYGEISTAKAAKANGIPMIVSSMSNQTLEDIAASSLHDNLWFQTYIFRNRLLTESLIQRAEYAGYKAILITVGASVTGKRERDICNNFSLPSHLTTGNFQSTANREVIYQFTAREFDSSLTWNDIEWVQKITKLPIFIKGILNPLDAEEACRLGIAGIVVSNHGGRQLDTTLATILALPDIINVVGGRLPVLLDGGIERGTDILKALALGADAILLGRPILWALAVNGKEQLEVMLTMLKKEFEIAMQLTGCCSVEEIKQFGKDLIYK